MRLLCLSLLTAGAAMWWIWSPSPEPEAGLGAPGRVAEVPEISQGGAEFVRKLPTAAVKRNDAAAQTISAHLLKKFNTTQSYRALLFEAIKHPESGGYLYAYAALGMCSEDAQFGNPEFNDPSRREAQSLLHARCDISKADREDALRQLAAAKGAEITRDPLLALTFDLLRAKDQAQKQSVIARGLVTEDPFLIRALVTPQSVNVQQGEPSFALLGKTYSGKTGEEIIGYAFDLVDCELGIDCGRSSTRALQLCVDKGWCGESVAASIKAGMATNRALAHAQVEMLARQIIDAVRKKDALALVRQ